MEQDIASIRQAIRDIPDFPKPGIVFKDITPLLSNGPLFRKTIDIFATRYQSQKIDTVLGIESAVLFSAPRWPMHSAPDSPSCASRGNYPMKRISELCARIRHRYLEIHSDGLPNHARVVIADDLIATGGNSGGNGRIGFQARGNGCGMCLRNRAILSEGQRKAQALWSLFAAAL